MARRPRDRWRDQAGHEDTRTDASGPDIHPVPDCPHKAEAEAARKRRRR